MKIIMDEVVSIEDYDRLLGEIQEYVDFEDLRKGRHVSYWESLSVVAAFQRQKLTSRTDKSIHKTIIEDVEKLMKDKSSRELDRLQGDIDLSIRENRRGDREYWESIAMEVKYQRAKALVKEIHNDLIANRLDHIQPAVEEVVDTSSSSTALNVFAEESEEVQLFLRREEEKGLEDNESLLQVEESLSHIQYSWKDKYLPRKPRYFNRVHTGFDWNKYNTTHYDSDNPPPRRILGYKFTIFYPDLVDVTKTPRYFLEATDESEYVIIRFHAGPPYEDIAFKILNMEWDKHPRAGFKCVFERGVLQLHFNFKRYWYRR